MFFVEKINPGAQPLSSADVAPFDSEARHQGQHRYQGYMADLFTVRDNLQGRRHRSFIGKKSCPD